MPVELSNKDTQRIEETLLVSRRMRNAAFYSLEGDEAIDPLFDAEQLITTSSQLVIAPKSQLEAAKTRDRLDRELEFMQERYDSYPPLAKKNLPPDISAMVMLDSVDSFDRDWAIAVQSFYNNGNEITIFGDDLLNPNVGILSPLSTDYHTAMIHSRYLRDVVGRPSFDVSPVAIHPDSGVVFFDSRDTFADKKHVAGYVDVSGSGATKNVLFQATKRKFGSKIAHTNR